jgi:alkanesulfonate monooxygenase SsuD/methylene tetrahydromethanopterin reductase-like flavin-dependent oxidoreductase (luciferase family)
VILGGDAGPRGARLAARWADEYNTVFPTPDELRERRARIERACEAAGREPIPVSVMTGFIVGRDREELHDRARAFAERMGGDASDPDAFLRGLDDAWIVGTLDEATERLGALRDAGAHRVMLQNLLHADLDVLALIGELAPRVA